MGWRDTIRKPSIQEEPVTKAPSWRDTIRKSDEPVIEEMQVDSPEVTQAEALKEGLKEGVSFGFWDEIEAGMDTGSFSGPAYKQKRDELRAKARAARDQWLKTYMGGAIGGGVVTGLIPGGAVARGATVAKTAAKAAGVGAAEGLVAGVGATEEESVKEILKDGLVGAAAGGVLGGALGAAGKKVGDKLAKGKAPKKEFIEDPDGTQILDKDATQITREVLDSNIGDELMESVTRKSSANADKDEAWKRVFLDKELEIVDKLPKKGTIDPDSETAEELFALKRYMRYVVQGPMHRESFKKAGKRLEETGKIGKSHFADLRKDFEMARRSGLVTDESFNSWRSYEYLTEALVTKQRDRFNRATMGRSITPEQFKQMKADNYLKMDEEVLGRFGKKWYNYNVALRTIGDKVNLGLEELAEEYASAANRKTLHIADLSRLAGNAARARKKSGYSSEEVYDMISRGDISKIPEVAEAFGVLSRRLLDDSHKAGMMIEDAGKNYIPKRALSGVDRIKALKTKGEEVLDQIEKMSQGELEDAFEIAQDDLSEFASMQARRKKGELWKRQSKTLDIAEYVNAMGTHFNKRILDLADLRETIKKLDNRQSRRNAVSYEVGAAFKREGEIPSWLLDRNIDDLFTRNIDQLGTAIYTQPIVNRVRARSMALEALGQKNAAELLDNWSADQLNIYRDNRMVNWGLREKLVAGGHENLAAFMDIAQKAIYPNMLGLRVDKVVRNSLQPLLMTSPEMGSAYAGIAAKELVKSGFGLRNVGSLKKIAKELKDDGLIGEDFTGEMVDSLRNGISKSYRENGIVQKSHKAFDAYAKVVLHAYKNSDILNRHVTRKMSHKLATDILMDSPRATKAVAKLPHEFRKRVSKLQNAYDIADGEVRDQIESEMKNMLARHYIAKTQLIYGKSDMFEMGRELGPMFSMFTKWPVSTTSEAIYHIRNGEYVRPALKYLGPLIAASTVGFGKWMPATSLFNFSNPPAISGAQKVIETAGIVGEVASGDKKAQRKLKARAKQLTSQFVPLLGLGAGVARDEFGTRKIREALGK